MSVNFRETLRLPRAGLKKAGFSVGLPLWRWADELMDLCQLFTVLSIGLLLGVPALIALIQGNLNSVVYFPLLLVWLILHDNRPSAPKRVTPEAEQ